MINRKSLYMIEGHDLTAIADALTQINSMSGQQLAGKGDELRDLVQKAQSHMNDAVEADTGELVTCT